MALQGAAIIDFGAGIKRFVCSVLCVLLLAVIWVSPASAIVTAEKNSNLVEGKIAIGMREELGDNMAEIEKILRANPRVRIGWPSEYEVSADPDSPGNYYLIDMDFAAASSVYRKWDQGPYTSGEVSSAPIFIGRLDDGSFGKDLEAALQKIERRKTLRAIRVEPIFRHGASMKIEFKPTNDNPNPNNSARLEVFNPLLISVEAYDGNDKPQFVYVLMIKPDYEVEWVIVTPNDNPIKPGQTMSYDFGERDFQFEDAGRYEFLTISSDNPINDGLFTSGTAEHIRPGSCSSLLERMLCEVITDTPDPTLPRQIDANEISDWSTSFSVHYSYKPSQQAVGGGVWVPPGYAPWQVEIFSNVPYTKAQIAADKRLPKSKSKFLWKLKKFQREHRCGGSLIAQNVVLTAAHCVAKGQFANNNRVLKDRRVRVGTQSLERGGKIYLIDSVVVHKGYRPGRPPNDIALLKIKPLNRRVAQKPILLPDAVSNMPKLKSGDFMEVLGWGYTGVVRGGHRPELSEGTPQAYVSDLRKGNLMAMSLEKCRRINKYASVNSKSICATSPPRNQASVSSGNTFSCRGDSGGPVIRCFGRKKVQIGLVSWGIGCGAKARNHRQNPSVFVDVAQYTSWIKTAKRSFVSGQVRKK